MIAVNFHQLVSDLIVNTETSVQLFRPELAICGTIVLMLFVRIFDWGRRIDSFYIGLAGTCVALFYAAPWTHLADGRTEIFTGMLVYAAGSFLQLIEGDDAGVELIWDRIRMDPRHTALRVLQDGSAQARLFGEWSMGFEHPDTDRLEKTLPGYRADTVYPFVDSQLVGAADTAATLLTLYARGSD